MQKKILHALRGGERKVRAIVALSSLLTVFGLVASSSIMSFFAPKALAQAPAENAGPVVYCHDSARGIVTRSLARDCASDAVVSEKEANRLRNESAERRRRLIMEDKPGAVPESPPETIRAEPAPKEKPVPPSAVVQSNGTPPKPPPVETLGQPPVAEPPGPSQGSGPTKVAPTVAEPSGVSAEPLTQAPRPAAPPPPGRAVAKPSPLPPMKDAGWAQISASTFRSVMTTATADRGSIGPVGVLLAWNNVAFDGERYIYAHGGGHADYGGNEVYRYDLVAKAWERLNEPAPYPPRILTNPDGTPTGPRSDARCPAPLSGPPSTHTYDGKVWSSALKRLLVFNSTGGFCPSGIGERGGDGNVWAFDPVTRAWENLGPLPAPIGSGSYLWSAELPNGNIIIGRSNAEVIWDPRNRTKVGERLGYASEGEGSAVYDPVKNRVVVANRFRIATIQLDANYNFAGRRETIPLSKDHLGGIGFDGSSAIAKDGRLIRWGGKRHVVAINLDTGERQVYMFPSGPGEARSFYLYDRMFALPDGTFVAVSNNPDEGVWRLKLPDGPGLPLPTQTLQQQFDSGARKFAPGLYSGGLLITRGASVDMTGVTPGIAEGKAAVVVRTSEPVVVENLTVSGLRGGGNVAGVKAEGVNFNVTIRKAHISDCEMGILTDNRGGRLVVENSVVENNGRPNGNLGHGIYAGSIDELVIRNVRVLRSKNNGHLVKSRARTALIENNVLAGLDGSISRVIDLSAGGNNTIRGNIIQHGPGETNPEMIGIALETINPQWTDAQASLIENNTFISDVTKRPQSSVVAAIKVRTTESTNPDGTKGPPHKVRFLNNRLVWADAGFLKGRIAYGDPVEVAGNQEFMGRAAAGLKAYPAIPAAGRGGD